MQPTGHPPRGQWQLLWVVSTVICAGDAREQLAERLPWQTSAAHSSSPTTAQPIGLASRHLHIVVFISVGARALLSCHIPPWQPPCEQAPGHTPWPAHGPSSLLSEGPHWHFPGSPSGSSELRAQDICESSQGQGGPSCGTTSHLCAVVTLERIRPGRERLGAVRTAGTGRDGEGARLACLMGHLTSHGEESQTKGRPCAVGHLPGSRAGLRRLTVLSRADLMPFSPTPVHPRLQ